MITQTLPSTTETGESVGVPVIDISGFLAGTAQSLDVVSAIGAACERVGFVVITGHGIPAELVERMYDVSNEFFALPDEDKAHWVSPTGNFYRGYQPGSLRENLEVGRFDDADEVRSAGYGPEWASTYEPNIWPMEPVDLRAIWREYYGAMEQLAARVMELFALALDLPAGWFSDKFDHHTSYLSANRYRPQAVEPPPGELRINAHTDIGSLTILYQDGAPGGLQVLDRGERWCDVPAVAGSFVINLGDMLAKWTNDRWVATPHRVVNPPREFATAQRISIPYFQHPNFDALIECIPSCTSPDNPPKYRSVLGGNWAKYRMSLGF
jgi:isopenicillin N synthase-like dioxygenase